MKQITNEGEIPVGSRPDPDPTLRTMELVDKAIANVMLNLESRFDSIETRFEAMDKAALIVHEDYVRVPTVVDKSVTALKELVVAEVDKIQDVTRERFARVEAIFNARAVALDAALIAAKEVSEERFSRIDTLFVEIEKRTNQLSVADKTAVAAALQAAKEAVGAQNTSNSVAITKSESSTIESIRQLQMQFTNSIDALNDKISDLKSRFDRGEGKTSVSDPAVSDGISKLGLMIADLAKSRDTTAGQAKGASDNWALIVSIIGVAVSVATVVIIVVSRLIK